MQLILEGLSLHVIYCNADKRPIGAHGWYSAVADAASIARLERGPNIGVATGKISGIVVIDVDPRHGGDETFAEELSWLPPTRTQQGGGQHLIYRYPPQGIRPFTGTVKNGLPGIELKSDGNGIICPPSPGYSVIDDGPIADFPDRLRELMARPPRKGNDAPDASLMVCQPDRIPKPLYDMVCRLVRPPPIRQRRVIGGLKELVRTHQGRNKVCFNKAVFFRKELIREGIIEILDAADLLFMAMQINGYMLKPNGKYRAESTIRSGLDLHPGQWSPDH
jgi:hypothetical protein